MALALGVAPAAAAFTAAVTNASSVTAAATFSDYPTTVGTTPLSYYRLNEAASSASTSNATDSSGHGRTGTYNAATNGPSSWFRFDEGSGATRVSDAAGSGISGTLGSGVTWSTRTTPSRQPSGDPCLTFANSSTANITTDGTAADSSASFTVSAWINLNASAGTTRRTAVGQDGTSNSVWGLGIYGSSGQIAFMISDNDQPSPTYEYAFSNLTYGSWQHVTGVFDRSVGTYGTQYIYVNGSLVTSTARTAAPVMSTGPLAFGRGWFNGAASNPWYGSVDDVRVFPRALNATEVGYLDDEPMALQYRFDDLPSSFGSGQTTQDDVGGSPTGTTYNAGRVASDWTYGLGMNGTTSYATAPAGAATVATNASFTVSAALYTSTSTGLQAVLSENGSNAQAFELGRNGTGWFFRMRQSDSTGAGLDTVSYSWAGSTEGLNRWVVLTGVFDSSASMMYLYADGSLVASASHSSLWTPSNPLQIGRAYSGGWTDYWNGSADRVQAYRWALSAGDVRQLFTDGMVTRFGELSGGADGALQGSDFFASQGNTTAVRFSGSANGYDQTSIASPGPGPFSEECWFKVASGYGGGVLTGFASDRTGSWSGMYDRIVYLTSTGRVSFGVNPTASSPTTITSTSAYNDGSWHHVVATLSSGNGARLYVDGRLVASNAAMTSAQSFAGWWRWGGANLNSWPNLPSDYYLVGTLDEVAFYSTELSAQEVAWHYYADH
ncbi:MAG: LamG domain-containing protein [Kineosporiaceae bacterium]